MSLHDSVLRISSTDISLFELLVTAVLLGLLLLIWTLVFVLRLSRNRGQEALANAQRNAELEYRLAELSGSLRSFADQSQGAQAQLARTLDERLDQVSERVGFSLIDQGTRTAQSLTALGERLAVIDAAQKNLDTLSAEMISLKDILSNKQTRGAYGQGRMEAIIRDGLPSRAYAFQATLSNGTRPDCLISLPESDIKLVIDAKFPLEAFTFLRGAATEAETKQAETQLKSDVFRHIRDISEKYLISGETHETAILFLPSESIYADIHERFEDLVQRAHRAHVILASPNVLMLLVQTLQAIFRDSAMREQAHVIKVEVSRLLEDVGRMTDRVGALRKHFGLAQEDLEKIATSATKVGSRAERIQSLDLDPVPSLETPAAPAGPKLVSRQS